VQILRAIAGREMLLVGDLVLAEVLAGARDDAHAAAIERELRRVAVVAMLDDRLAVLAAKNHRNLRAIGITVRKSIDLLIGTFCIEAGHELLHDDRDFEPMHAHLGLKTLG
jgi:predicted nucleic acid-binding protein